MIEIDEHKTIELLREAVAERGPDFVYPKRSNDGDQCNCRYVYAGEPDCGVALALPAVGVRLPCSLRSKWIVGRVVRHLIANERLGIVPTHVRIVYFPHV